MKRNNIKNILRGGFLAFLIMVNAVMAFADSARVVSKQENMPHHSGNLMTRVFLDITPDNEDKRADAYVDIPNTNRSMSMMEFSDMIQVGDIIEHEPCLDSPQNGRYKVIAPWDLTHLNKDNIYRIFAEDLRDEVFASSFIYARQAYYEALNRQREN
jgi:hypothetical protein